MCHVNLEWFCCERGVLSQIIAVDGMLTWACEPEQKQQSSTSHHGSPRSHKIYHLWSWWSFGIWHPRCSCVSCHSTGSDCEYTVLQPFQQYNLWCAARQKCPELAETGIILHDNALAHSAHTCKNVLLHWGWDVLQHHPYSPDLSPCDYDLNPHLRQPLHGKWFANRENILMAVWHEVAHISTAGDADGVCCLLHHWRQALDNLREILWRLLIVCMSSLYLYSLFDVHFLCHKKIIKPWLKTGVVCLPAQIML
jgi:hypothetical protein